MSENTVDNDIITFSHKKDYDDVRIFDYWIRDDYLLIIVLFNNGQVSRHVFLFLGNEEPETSVLCGVVPSLKSRRQLLYGSYLQTLNIGVHDQT